MNKMTGAVRLILCMIAAVFALIPVAVAARLQVSLADAPSVKLHFATKRSSVHGLSKFDVFAKPVVSSNGAKVMYDGYITFKDADETFTYFFVNGAGYMSTGDGDVRCLPSDTLPFDLILPALNDAVPIPSATIGDKSIECESGNLFKTVFASTSFAICASSESGFTAYSSDITIDVAYLDTPISIPSVEGAKCDAVAVPTSVTPTALALLTGSAIPLSISRHLETSTHVEMDASSCKCKDTPRPCIFFHGASNPNEMDELQDTPKNSSGRIGNMNKHAPCCSIVKYAILNTKDYQWTDDKHQEKVCDRALRFSGVKTNSITNTVIVTYSAAGLAMAMAIATGKCSFGTNATWVAVGTPMTGTMLSDTYQKACNKTSSLKSKMLYKLGECPSTRGRMSVAYQYGNYATKELYTAYVMAQKAYKENVDAALCGTNDNGLLSPYRPIMLLTGKLSHHKSSEQDGVVEFQSCAKGLDISKFHTSYKSPFYKAKINHADVGFLTHDGFFDDSQKPAKWFECLL
ncbi:putative alpha/Beta hydrolase [Plasmopara halstedii]